MVRGSRLQISTSTVNGDNKRAYTSARIVRIDELFKDANFKVISTHKGITKAKMKEIEATKIRELRKLGYELPHNKEKGERYQPGYKGK